MPQKIAHSVPLVLKGGPTATTRTFLISTSTADRQGDVLEPHGVRLDAYRKNPIVLYAHAYSNLPIGRSTRVDVTATGLEADVEFAPTEFAQQVKALVDEGFIQGASVGFIPLKGTVRPEGGMHYTSWELLEWSIVPVPANPDALLARAKAVGINVSALEALDKRQVVRIPVTIERLRQMIATAVNEQLARLRNKKG